MKLTVGIIGAGGNTRLRHIPGFREIDDVEIVAVANRTMESSKAAAEEHGIPKAYTNWQELINDPGIDAICIGTWPYVHEAITVAALESGKHVLCEARMASNLDEATSMYSAQQQCPELVSQLVPAPFTLRHDKQITDLIATGRIGKLLSIDVIAQTPVAVDAPMSFRNETALSGINTMTLGIWYEALMRWVGTASHVVALSQLHTAHRKEGDTLKPVTIPDHLEVLGELTSGAALHMRVSAASKCAQNQVTLVGTEGTLCLNDGKLALSSDGQQWETIEPRGNDWRVEQDFIESIREGKPVVRTSFVDGLRYMAFTEAVMSSAAEGGTVAVEVY